MCKLPPTAKRVALHTSPRSNRKIEQTTMERLGRLEAADAGQLKDRLEQLDREWDTERVLETNASILILAGLLLSRWSQAWLLLPLAVSAFLLQHALQGWCPPLPLIRALGVRTAKEIESEWAKVLVILAQRDAL